MALDRSALLGVSSGQPDFLVEFSANGEAAWSQAATQSARRNDVPVKILVADDSATMRSIMQMTFAGEDAEIVTVDSGSTAIERAKQLRPDVVFADASMNGVDGYEVARGLKSDPSTAGAKVIVLTSQFHAFDEAKARGAGVDDHVDKPFDSQVAIDKVGEVLARARASSPGAVAAPAAVAATAPPAAPVRSAAPPRPPAARPAPPPPNSTVRKPTVGFGSTSVPAAPAASRRPAPPPRSAAPAAPTPSAPTPAAPTPAALTSAAPTAAASRAPANAVAAATGDLASKLQGLGLTSDQMNGVLALSREVVEKVVWEVVPDLAETMIREEIKRLTAE